MKNKLIIALGAVILITAAAKASLTTATVTDFVDVQSGCFGGYIWGTSFGWDRDLAWTHQNPYFPGDPGKYEDALNGGLIKEVTLSIYACLISENGQDPDQVAIAFTDAGREGERREHNLLTWALPGDDPTGYLNNGWTHYRLDPGWLDGVDVHASVDYEKSYCWDFLDDAYIKYSKLSVTYYHSSAPPDSERIPAPGAILLGGIGIGLVGWLRRRRFFL